MRHALVSPRRGARRQRWPRSAAHGAAFRVLTWLAVILGVIAAAVIADHTGQGRLILGSVERFLLFYSGVFALLALTAAVVMGLVSSDRVLMTPRLRVAGQALHRALALGAMVALAAHIVLEIGAHRSHVVDAFVPFLAQNRTLYIGLGTIASDMLVLVVVTSIARGRFAPRWPRAWRPIHAISYAAWVLSILHGLLAGRTAKPYVDWSYGVCVALVGVALVLRLRGARHPRARRPAADGPVPGRPVPGRPAPAQPVPAQPVPAQPVPLPARLPRRARENFR